MKKEGRLCVISVTTLDAQLIIDMHLLINRILEEEPITTLDIQQNTIEQIETLEIEGTMEETSKIKGMMEEMSEMIEGTMKGPLELRRQ